MPRPYKIKRKNPGWFTSKTIPWNKEKKGIHLSPLSEIKKGQHLSPATEFGKFPAWNKNKKLWTGTVSEYNKLHYWVRKMLGAPSICQICSETKSLVWANKSQKYLRQITDWISLCRSCHMKMDHNATKLKYGFQR